MLRPVVPYAFAIDVSVSPGFTVYCSNVGSGLGVGRTKTTSVGAGEGDGDGVGPGAGPGVEYAKKSKLTDGRVTTPLARATPPARATSTTDSVAVTQGEARRSRSPIEASVTIETRLSVARRSRAARAQADAGSGSIGVGVWRVIEPASFRPSAAVATRPPPSRLATKHARSAASRTSSAVRPSWG